MKGVLLSLVLCLVLSYLASVTTAANPVITNGTNLQLYACDGSFRQQWTFASLPTIRLVQQNYSCIDIEDYGTTNGSNIWLYACHTSDVTPNQQNQEWTYSGGNIIAQMSGLCVDVVGEQAVPGARIELMKCDGSNSQLWYWDNTTYALKNGLSGLCLDAGSALPNSCGYPQFVNLPFCQISLGYLDRAKDLVSRIPNDSKIALFQNTDSGVPALLIPPYQWWSEALHGVAYSPGVTFGGEAPFATSFPQVCLTGASFDTALWNAIGTAISTEARAMANVNQAGLTFWAPNLNIFRDPRWGRGQETPGEDPYLNSMYVTNFVTGMQVGEDPLHLKVSSCCKHYDAYSLEDWEGMDRYHFDAIVQNQDFVDTYWPAFEACVHPAMGGGSGMMCAYNAVNGIPACADDWLMTSLARDTWKFNGYITSDCGAVPGVQYDHYYTNTTDETCRVVLEAGMDIECGNFLPDNLEQALNDGSINEALLDEHLINLFAVRIRLGMFDPPGIQPYLLYNTSLVNSPEHQQLALQAAQEGIVLLKNDQNFLPLNIDAFSNIALVGPNANATTTMQGNYYGDAPYLISPQQGLESYGAKVNFVFGCAIADNDTAGFDDACAAAAEAQVTIMIMGLDQTQESEGHDRTIISFPGVQEEFISKISQCTQTKVILVVMSGGSVDLTLAKANPQIAAILWVGYPGQSGGQALADVIYGAISPAGRTDYTWYPADFIEVASMENMDMRPNTTANYPGRGYRFYTGEAVYPFGYGLSYTNFTYVFYNTSTPNVTKVSSKLINYHIAKHPHSRWTLPKLETVAVKVNNTGKVASDVVVIAYSVGPNPGQNGNPLQEVIGFERIHSLAPGQIAIVYIDVSMAVLTRVNEVGEREAVVGTWTIKVEDAIHHIVVY